MAKYDRFSEDYTKLEVLEKQINGQLKEREIAVKHGEAPGRFDYPIKNAIDNMNQQLKNLDKQIYLYESEPQKYTEISQKEKDKRKVKYETIKEKTEQLVAEIKVTLSSTNAIRSQQHGPNNYSEDLEGKPLMQKGRDGEYDDTRGQTNKQAFAYQKKMLKDQDQDLDQLGGIISNIKYDGQNFQTEVKHQNKMLGKLNTDMDKTEHKMKRLDNKLEELIAKSSQCCLWVTITLEIVALVLVIILL